MSLYSSPDASGSRCPKTHRPPILSPSPRPGDASFLQTDRPDLPGKAVREGRAAGGIPAPQGG